MIRYLKGLMEIVDDTIDSFKYRWKHRNGKMADNDHWIPFSVDKDRTFIATYNQTKLVLPRYPTQQELEDYFLLSVYSVGLRKSMKLINNLANQSPWPRWYFMMMFGNRLKKHRDNIDDKVKSMFKSAATQRNIPDELDNMIDWAGLECKIALGAARQDLSPVNTSLPKVKKGKETEFLEWITIGIETDIFEGSSKAKNADFLIKGFGADLESDNEIYHQRKRKFLERTKLTFPLVDTFFKNIEKQHKIGVKTGIDRKSLV